MTIQLFLSTGVLLLLSGCASQQVLNDHIEREDRANKVRITTHHQSPGMATAIATAPPASKKVLRQIEEMIAADEIIVGGCWDYLNEAFNRAGYPQKKRKTLFKGVYKKGPYADISLIKPGDWLYYVNHSYNDIEHSGLFIGWTDKAKKQALIFSYAGEGRTSPARYRVYTIDQVYRIKRATD